MFRPRKVQEFSFAKTSKKFLSDRESFQRIKHLRCIIDNIVEAELKTFFKRHYSLIFNAFYDVFMNVQLELQQKVNTSHYKELQYILAVFEKIITLLPEFITRKWQYNCIFTIIKTLLHPNNILKIREQGMQLYILWFQILAQNAPKSCYDIFISLIPIFEPIIKRNIYSNIQKKSSSEAFISINEIEMKPVLTQNIDKEVELNDVDQDLLRYLLRYIVTEGIKVEWDDERDEKQLDSYTFIIDQFKVYFLPVIFPKCSSDYTIEKNMEQGLITAEFLENYSPVIINYPIDGYTIFCYQEEVVRWISELLYMDHTHIFPNFDSRSKRIDIQEEEMREISLKEHNLQSRTSTIDNVLVSFEKETLRIELSAFEKIHQILFQSEENVNVINQLCQHGLYLPLQFHKTHLSIIFVYKSWLFSGENKQPPFMLDTEASSSPIVMREISHSNDSTNEGQHKVKISRTMQKVIFTNVATVFLHNLKDLSGNQISLSKKQYINAKQVHSDLAKRIIANIYRKAVHSISNLDNEHLMRVLLDISFNVLSCNTPLNRPDNHWISNDAPIGQFFQTLNVLLIKSNLVTYISEKLWNRFLQVYSSLVRWNPIVVEWKKTLDLILKVLGKTLYNIDMADLPLEKKVKRGRMGNNLKRSNGSKIVKRLFSSDEQLPNTNSTVEPNQSNTMNYNSSLANTLNIHPKNTFTESLNQNTEEILDNFSNQCVRSDIEDLNQSETNKKFQFDESNENDAGSFASSSHEENSSYMSAEDSSSPHCKDKTAEPNSGLLSDNEFPQQSSSGDTSIEINGSFDSSIKPLYGEDIDDNNIDADDEYEGEINNSLLPAIFDGESKSATLTREESDIDISSQIYRFRGQENANDSSRTPTKYSVRRKTHQSKEKNRNSMHIDDNIVNDISNKNEFSDQAQSLENVNSRHVLLGGVVIGWNQESSVLLWRRCIGLLGNVTQITDVNIMLMIFGYFSDLSDSLIKMRENMCVPNGNQISQQPPLFVPPIDYIVPWLFEIFTLDSMFDDAKMIALKTLCRITVRKMDIEPPIEHLVQFYSLIHTIIQTENMKFICTLIESLGAYLFSIPLCGSEIIIVDVIKACEMILQHSQANDDKRYKLPKLEAVSILASLLKYQDHYGTIKTLDLKIKNINITDSPCYKADVLRLLAFCAKNECHLAPRTLSIISIALYCYSEIIYSENFPNELNDIRQNILLLLSLMRFDNNEIATISVDMIRFLVICCPQIQEKLPHIIHIIIQALSWNINETSLRFKRFPTSGLRKLLTSMIFTLVDWCMSLPLSQLLDSIDLHPKGLVHLAFSALENILKYEECSIIDKYSTSLKQTINDKNQTTEGRKTSAIISNHQSTSHYTVMHDTFIDPLIEFPVLFEVQPIKEKLQDLPSVTDDPISNAKLNELINLAARTALCHLINHIGQFPKNNVLGCLSSCVQEHHDFQVCKIKPITESLTENSTSDILSTNVFNSSDLQMFVVNGSMIVSLLSINSKFQSKLQNANQLPAPGGPPITTGISESSPKESEVRIIIRDLCGKYCWDVTFVNKYEDDTSSYNLKYNKEADSIPPSPPPRRTLPATTMTEKSSTLKGNKVDKLVRDQVDMLLDDLAALSPEMISSNSCKSFQPESPQINLESLVKQIQDQNTIESNYFNNNHCFKISHPKLVERKLRSNTTIEKCPEPLVPHSKFYLCRQILNQLGFLSLKRRASIDLIQKSNIYLHLKCIDGLRSRETHKIAVLYVGWGQEDKESILGNTESSLEFNSFISGLGWTVDLETHRGFMGGLESDGKNGKYAPYYANSSLEIMFHVSTWMQSSSAEDKPNKFKHLGNDEVMVIWSENYRNFRSNITKTEFGDVMIIIYPLRNGLFAINIKTKGEFKLFGPLFDGAIVGERELPGLVRNTAINAGRSIRESKQHFEEYFVARANYMQKAIKQFIEPMSYEDFAENIYGIPFTQQDEPQNDIVRGSATSESTKTNSVKISDVSITSNNSEIIPNKGVSRVSVSAKSNRTLVTIKTHASFDNSVDHSLNRKLSKNSQHLK